MERALGLTGARASSACTSALRTAHPLREVQALVPLVLPPLDDLFTRSLVSIIMLTLGHTGLAANAGISASRDTSKTAHYLCCIGLAKRAQVATHLSPPAHESQCLS